MEAADTLPAPLAAACDAFDAAKDALATAVESWLLGEVAAVSARLKNRTVTLYSGNGAFSLHVARRRPLTWGDNAERKAFVAYDFDPSKWARWLPAPALFAALAEAEMATEMEYLAPIGAFAFRNGAPIA